MSKKENNKITINDKDYNYEDLSKEQQILVEHINQCRTNKSQLAFQLDRENVAESAFANLLTKSFEEKDEKGDDNA